MLTGVLIFGGAVFFFRRSGDAPGVDAEQAKALLWIGRVTWATAIVGCIVVYQLARRSGEKGERLHIVAWAMGEMVALYGGVVWFLTGAPAWYVPGLVYLVMTFLAFPGRRRA